MSWTFHILVNWYYLCHPTKLCGASLNEINVTVNYEKISRNVTLHVNSRTVINISFLEVSHNKKITKMSVIPWIPRKELEFQPHYKPLVYVFWRWIKPRFSWKGSPNILVPGRTWKHCVFYWGIIPEKPHDWEMRITVFEVLHIKY